MSARPWYLARRITLVFGLTTLILSLTLSGLAIRTIRATVQEEIDALAWEELEETRAFFSGGARTPADFQDAALDMTGQHPDNPLAWKIWRSQSQEAWGEFGPTRLLGAMPSGLVSSPEPTAYPGSLRWITVELTPELSLGVMVDGSSQYRRFQRFVLAAAGFVLVSTLLATLAGFLVGRRIARLLRQVARSTRLADDPSQPDLDGTAAPQEIRDVVEALHNTLRRIRTEAENARVVTAGLAHELRSPLQNLVGETQVALLRERDALEYRQVLESHLEELGQLSRVVDNLVTLCSAGELRRRQGSERFDLGDEARLRLSREFQLAARRAVELAIETRGAVDYQGDRESILLALRNLVTNAIEWSPAQGRVEVLLRGDERALEVCVDDSGPGVPLAERSRIFQPFHRGPAARGRRVGFGLGLALTRSAVEAHGGTIEVGESPLGGARFRILLPRRGEPGRRAPQDTAPSPESLLDEGGPSQTSPVAGS